MANFNGRIRQGVQSLLGNCPFQELGTIEYKTTDQRNRAKNSLNEYNEYFHIKRGVIYNKLKAHQPLTQDEKSFLVNIQSQSQSVNNQRRSQVTQLNNWLDKDVQILHQNHQKLLESKESMTPTTEISPTNSCSLTELMKNDNFNFPQLGPLTMDKQTFNSIRSKMHGNESPTKTQKVTFAEMPTTFVYNKSSSTIPDANCSTTTSCGSNDLKNDADDEYNENDEKSIDLYTSNGNSKLKNPSYGEESPSISPPSPSSQSPIQLPFSYSPFPSHPFGGLKGQLNQTKTIFTSLAQTPKISSGVSGSGGGKTSISTDILKKDEKLQNPIPKINSLPPAGGNRSPKVIWKEFPGGVEKSNFAIDLKNLPPPPLHPRFLQKPPLKRVRMQSMLKVGMQPMLKSKVDPKTRTMTTYNYRFKAPNTVITIPKKINYTSKPTLNEKKSMKIPVQAQKSRNNVVKTRSIGTRVMTPFNLDAIPPPEIPKVPKSVEENNNNNNNNKSRPSSLISIKKEKPSVQVQAYQVPISVLDSRNGNTDTTTTMRPMTLTPLRSKSRKEIGQKSSTNTNTTVSSRAKAKSKVVQKKKSGSSRSGRSVRKRRSQKTMKKPQQLPSYPQTQYTRKSVKLQNPNLKSFNTPSYEQSLNQIAQLKAQKMNNWYDMSSLRFRQIKAVNPSESLKMFSPAINPYLPIEPVSDKQCNSPILSNYFTKASRNSSMVSSLCESPQIGTSALNLQQQHGLQELQGFPIRPSKLNSATSSSIRLKLQEVKKVRRIEPPQPPKMQMCRAFPGTKEWTEYWDKFNSILAKYYKDMNDYSKNMEMSYTEDLERYSKELAVRTENELQIKRSFGISTPVGNVAENLVLNRVVNSLTVLNGYVIQNYSHLDCTVSTFGENAQGMKLDIDLSKYDTDKVKISSEFNLMTIKIPTIVTGKRSRRTFKLVKIGVPAKINPNDLEKIWIGKTFTIRGP